MSLVDSFPKDKVVSNVFLMSGNGKLFVTSTWQKRKELSLNLFFPTPFPFHWCKKFWWSWLELGGFCVRFSNPFCVLQFADVKSLSWKVLKKGSGVGLGNTPFIAFAIPYGVYKYESNYCTAAFFFPHENPFWIISLWYFFVLSVSYIWKKFCSFYWLSLIFLFRVKELVFSSWPQTTEYNIQRSCSAYTFLFIWFWVFGNWSCLTFTFYCCYCWS